MLMCVCVFVSGGVDVCTSEHARAKKKHRIFMICGGNGLSGVIFLMLQILNAKLQHNFESKNTGYQAEMNGSQAFISIETLH